MYWRRPSREGGCGYKGCKFRCAPTNNLLSQWSSERMSLFSNKQKYRFLDIHYIIDLKYVNKSKNRFLKLCIPGMCTLRLQARRAVLFTNLRKRLLRTNAGRLANYTNYRLSE